MRECVACRDRSRPQQASGTRLDFALGAPTPATTAVLRSAAPQLCVPGRLSVPGSADGPQKNIYRCRTAADWFVLRSEQTSHSHIFGGSYAVLVSRLRY